MAPDLLVVFITKMLVLSVRDLKFLVTRFKHGTGKYTITARSVYGCFISCVCTDSTE